MEVGGNGVHVDHPKFAWQDDVKAAMVSAWQIPFFCNCLAVASCSTEPNVSRTVDSQGRAEVRVTVQRVNTLNCAETTGCGSTNQCGNSAKISKEVWQQWYYSGPVTGQP